MAIEEVGLFLHHTKEYCSRICVQEFSIEIPDKEADAIHSSRFRMQMGLILLSSNTLSVDKAVNYILSQPDGKLSKRLLSKRMLTL